MPSGTTRAADSSTELNGWLRRAIITISGLRVTTTAGCAISPARRRSTISTGQPSTLARSVVRVAGGASTLPLGVLRRLPCPLQTVLLALFLSRIAGEQPRRLEDRAQLWIRGDQCASDSVAHSTGLPGDAATEHLDRDLVASGRVGDAQRLRDHGLEVTASEILARWTVVDDDDTVAGDDAHARDGRFATAGGLLVGLNLCGQR